jgi:hypothetical protein
VWVSLDPLVQVQIWHRPPTAPFLDAFHGGIRYSPRHTRVALEDPIEKCRVRLCHCLPHIVPRRLSPRASRPPTTRTSSHRASVRHQRGPLCFLTGSDDDDHCSSHPWQAQAMQTMMWMMWRALLLLQQYVVSRVVSSGGEQRPLQTLSRDLLNLAFHCVVGLLQTQVSWHSANTRLE